MAKYTINLSDSRNNGDRELKMVNEDAFKYTVTVYSKEEDISQEDGTCPLIYDTIKQFVNKNMINEFEEYLRKDCVIVIRKRNIIVT